MEQSSNYKIGKNSKIDEKSIIGYLPSRRIEIVPLVMGDDAVVRAGTIVYTNTIIGNGLDTGHNAVIREENIIGDNFSIWNNTTIDYGCKIGDNVKIHCNGYVCQFTTIGSNVFIAPGVVFLNDPHPICTKCMKGATIEDGARIGGGVVILPHVRIGRNSLIGAGSIVTRDIPDNVLAFGNPARVKCNLTELKCNKGFKEYAYILDELK